MPTSRETVPNRQLSGDELRQLLTADWERLLANCGLLSPHIAYGRVGYEIILRLHLDNASSPLDETRLQSRTAARDQVKLHPELAAIETPPLVAPSPDSAAIALRRTRTIHSPNVERLREGIAVPVEVKQQDGTVTMEKIRYPKDESLEDGGQESHAPAESEMRADWKLLDEPLPVDVEPETAT